MLDYYRLDNKNILKGMLSAALEELISDDGIISDKSVQCNLKLDNVEKG